MKRIDLGAEVPFNFWESRLITDELVRAAAEDPALWASQANKIAHFDVNLRNGALAWQEGAQLLVKEVSGVSGVPASIASSVATGVTELYRGKPTSVQDLGIQLAHAGIGVVTNALAAIPIVGQIAGAIGGIASLLIGLAQDEPQRAAEFLPPLQDYSEEVDEWIVNNQVLPAVGTLDWTGLFLPRYRGTWRAAEREHGWAMRGSAPGSGVGFVPGTQRVTGILQTYFVYKSVRKGFQLAEARDQGSFYPGAAQILSATIEQAAKAQTQLYNVDTHAIERRWRDYIAGAIDLGTALWQAHGGVMWGGALKDAGMSTLTDEQARTIARAMMAQLTVSAVDGRIAGIGTYGWTPSNQGLNVFDAFIAPWCERVRARQLHQLGTIVGTAYTDESQAAFAGDQQLLLKLRINRGLLLSSPWRYKVVVPDMIDPSYKGQIFDATAGDTLVAAPPVGQVFVPDAPPDAAPQPPGGGAPFEPEGDAAGGLGPWVAAGAAIAAALAGWHAHKKGWI